MVDSLFQKVFCDSIAPVDDVEITSSFPNGIEKEEKQGKDGDKSKFVKKDGNGRRYENKNRMECWLCGKEGHLRFECPRKLGNKE